MRKIVLCEHILTLGGIIGWVYSLHYNEYKILIKVWKIFTMRKRYSVNNSQTHICKLSHDKQIILPRYFFFFRVFSVVGWPFYNCKKIWKLSRTNKHNIQPQHFSHNHFIFTFAEVCTIQVLLFHESSFLYKNRKIATHMSEIGGK